MRPRWGLHSGVKLEEVVSVMVRKRADTSAHSRHETVHRGVPWRTLPQFCGSCSRRTASKPKRRVKLKATCDVASLLPSSTTTTSYVKCGPCHARHSMSEQRVMQNRYASY